MTVDKVQPCVCSIENFEEEQRNDINYGMPVLLVHNSLYPYKQFWTTRCPKCGRGGLTEYGSAYKAIRAWNQLQAVLYMSGSPWEEEAKPGDTRTVQSGIDIQISEKEKNNV